MTVERVKWGAVAKRRRNNTSKIKIGNISFSPFVSRSGIRVRYARSVGPGMAGSSFPLFTFTSKMAAASFSLPSGPFAFGGSCPASAEKETRPLGVDAPNGIDPGNGKPWGYICSVCYAAKGRYAWAKFIHMGQYARLLLVKRLLLEGGPQAFARFMVGGIRVLTEDLFGLVDAKACSPNYFRIHDSGDFAIPGVHEGDYLAGWVLVARALPKIQFWAPTRLWPFPWFQQSVAAIASMGGWPENFMVRPSALYLNSPPPMLQGLPFAAGTMSASGDVIRKGKVVIPRAPIPSGVVDCPAYDDDTDTGTCWVRRCRKCWDHPETPINYRTH